MKRMTTTVMGLAALVAMLVLGVFSAGAAQAHVFEFGGAIGSLFLILGEGPQLFAPTPAAEVICNHVHLDGIVPAATQLTITAKGTYTNCLAAGKFNATVTEVEYELNADETVSVINKGILIEVEGVCTIHVFPTNNQNLSKIRYLVDPNSSSLRILAHAEVEKIHSVVLGGAGTCGAEGLRTAGSYRGLLLAWVHSPGTLKWS